MTTIRLHTDASATARHHISLIELVVFAAIVVMLSSVIVPAVYTARSEASFERWSAAQTTMIRRRNPAVYYTFETITTNMFPNLGSADLSFLDQGLSAQCDATAIGTTLVTAGGRWHTKNAVAFDGLNDELASAYPGISGANARTVCVWLKTFSRATQAVCGWGNPSPGNLWYIGIDGDNAGAVKLDVFAGKVIGTATVADRRWHHIAVVFADDGTPDVADARLFVDGRPDPLAITVPQPLYTRILARTGMRIGVHPAATSADRFHGKICEFAIFDRVLTDAEIKALFEEGRP